MGSPQTRFAERWRSLPAECGQGATQGAVQCVVARGGRDVKGTVQSAVAKSGKGAVVQNAVGKQGALSTGCCAGF
jgi:hypothetical protein